MRKNLLADGKKLGNLEAHLWIERSSEVVQEGVDVKAGAGKCLFPFCIYVWSAQHSHGDSRSESSQATRRVAGRLESGRRPLNTPSHTSLPRGVCTSREQGTLIEFRHAKLQAPRRGAGFRVPTIRSTNPPATLWRYALRSPGRRGTLTRPPLTPNPRDFVLADSG